MVGGKLFLNDLHSLLPFVTYINEILESVLQFFVLIPESDLLGSLLERHGLSVLTRHVCLRLLPADWHLVTTHEKGGSDTLLPATSN